MSNKPNPVALTAAMLAMRASSIADEIATIATLRGEKAPSLLIGGGFRGCASLASDLHRLAPACRKLAEAECNGEWRDGQRNRLMFDGAAIAALDASIAKCDARLDKRIARLNEALAPFALRAARNGDPRGAVLRLYSTDDARPLPSNGFGDGWVIG